MFIDAHCHLDSCKNPSDCVKRALDKNVKIIVTNGSNLEKDVMSLELAKTFPSVKAALGLYPIEALGMSDEEIEHILKFIKTNANKIVAIGEVGLDYKEDTINQERQRKIFSKIIDLALELDKPLIIHSRKAEADVIKMLEEAGVKKVQMHCFCGNMKMVQKIADNGWFISIPTNVKHMLHFQEIVKRIPIENLLCETDSPYLHPDKENNNEPANVITSYEKIAEIKGLTLNEVEKFIEQNYLTLFG